MQNDELKNFVFYYKWAKHLLRQKDKEWSMCVLWEIMRRGIGLDYETDDEDIIEFIEDLILPNVRAAQKRYDKANNGGRPKLEIDMERVEELKAAGKSNEEIGRIMGVSKETIRTRNIEWQKTKNQQKTEQKTKQETKQTTNQKQEKEKEIEIENENEIDSDTFTTGRHFDF